MYPVDNVREKVNLVLWYNYKQCHINCENLSSKRVVYMYTIKYVQFNLDSTCYIYIANDIWQIWYNCPSRFINFDHYHAYFFGLLIPVTSMKAIHHINHKVFNFYLTLVCYTRSEVLINVQWAVTIFMGQFTVDTYNYYNFEAHKILHHHKNPTPSFVNLYPFFVSWILPTLVTIYNLCGVNTEKTIALHMVSDDMQIPWTTL
jgi:hypothetical protein